MKYLRNIEPYKNIKMSDMITHHGKKIASKLLINTENHEIRFFSFAKDEDISKEVYEMESIFIVIEGNIQICYQEEEEVIVKEGEIIVLESEIPYGMKALTGVKLLNILVRN